MNLLTIPRFENTFHMNPLVTRSNHYRLEACLFELRYMCIIPYGMPQISPNPMDNSGDNLFSRANIGFGFRGSLII